MEYSVYWVWLEIMALSQKDFGLEEFIGIALCSPADYRLWRDFGGKDDTKI